MGETFTVELEPRGFRVAVGANESVLAALKRAGYGFPYSCRNGVCGLCKARLHRGRIHYAGIGAHGLSEQEQADGFILPCTAQPISDLCIEVDNVYAPGEIPPKTVACQVKSLEPVSNDTWRARLRLPVIERVRFEAGHYLFLLMPDGARRAFSIASAPEALPEIELHIRATPGHEAALAVVEHLKNAPVVRVELPQGQCVLRAGQGPLIFLAGGTGFAPAKAMIESLRAQGQTRPIHLYRGARSVDHLYLCELVRRWSAELPQFTAVDVLSEPDPAWTGRLGWVHEAVLADHPDLSGYEVYASGRAEMVFAAHTAFQAQGLPADRFYSDMLDLRQT